MQKLREGQEKCPAFPVNYLQSKGHKLMKFWKMCNRLLGESAWYHLSLLSPCKMHAGKRSVDRMGTQELLKKGIWLTEKNVTGLQSGKNSIFILQPSTYFGHYTACSRVTESGTLPQETLNYLNVMLNTINHSSDEIKINKSKRAPSSRLDFVTSV